MGFADKLRNEIENKDAEIIAKRFEPQKDRILNILAEGIRRIGYVRTDTFNNTGTHEGDRLGVKYGEVNAFAKFVTAEGFKVSRSWWGYSSDGEPDMLTITI